VSRVNGNFDAGTTRRGSSISDDRRDMTAPRPLRRLTAMSVCGFAVVLVASMVAVVTQGATTAGAATNGVLATWSSAPNCTSFVTATPPAGTVSATVTLNGGGGGGGGTNSGSGGTGGSGAQLTGTMALTHNTGAVSVKLGCGGNGGGTGGGGGASIGGASGGAGFGSGGTSGSATDEDVSVDGIAAGGGGGGATGLCLGTTACSTALAVAAGGGGGGAREDCTGSTGPGSGGTGQSGGSTTVSSGAGGTNGDGSDGTGGGGGTSAGGGGGGGGDSGNGSGGANTPYSSNGGSGGNGGGGFPVEAGASGGGGGGGYTGGGGGGGDKCTSGADAGGGGGGGASAFNTSFSSGISYNGNGGPGGGTSATGGAGTISLTWNVDNLSVTNPGSKSNVSGSAISPLTIVAPHDTTGGNAVSFSATGLPAGLSISASSGTISGTPTTAGNFTVNVTATDSEALAASATFSWTVTNTVTVSNPGAQSSLSGTAIHAVSASATDTSSTATISSYSATGLPPGLSISSSTGSISGTPTTAGTYSVKVTATDSAAFTGSATFAWTVTNNISVTNPGNQSSLSGTAIPTLAISASDTSSTTSLTYAATGLPAGLSISAITGAITGTPTTAGSNPVHLTVTDTGGFSANASFTWTVTNNVSATSPGNQSSVSGSAVAPLTVPVSDTSSTATVAISDGGTLPPGLSINPTTGTINGTPTTAGSYPVIITASDNAGFSAQATFTWTVTNIVGVTDPGDQADVSGSPIAPLAIGSSDTSSTATVGYSAGSTLPGGLSIDPSTGIVSGSPTIAGTYPVTVTVTDDAGFSASTSFTWTITNTVSVTNPGSQTNVSGSPITPLAIQASDSLSTATLTYSDGGTLPAGLSIDAPSGVISGTPTTAGTGPVTITVTDSASFAAQVTFNWTVSNIVSVPTPGNQSDPSGTAIAPVTIHATDSSTGATLTYSGGSSLPSGLSLNTNSGAISGTPTTAGSYPVVIRATDNAGFSGSTSFTWLVTNQVSVTNPGSQTTGSGTAITPVTIHATDSSAGVTLSYADGSSLPPGLRINSATGAITGTPTTGGSFPVTITVTDSAGYSGSTAFTWHVTNTVTVGGVSDQTGGVGAAITPLHVTASDSSSTATLSYSAGSTLPVGLSINSASGVISGTPTKSGVYAVTITVTDSAGFTGTTSFNWTVVGPVVSALKPQSGPGAGGTKVQITGSHFVGATSVSFGSVPATSFTVNGPGTKITAVDPREAAGTVNVVVTTAAGPSIVTAADRFTYLGPAITTISPTSGSGSGGTKVSISGTGLSGTTSVSFGTVPATSFTVNGPGTKITAVSPAHAGGVVNIVVTTPGGTTVVAPSDQFTYLGPVITKITPTSGSVAGGTRVSISGTGLSGATSVMFGTVAASSVTVNAKGTKLTAVSPVHAAGAVNIVITTPGGTTTNNAADTYTFVVVAGH
jgi:hypothetical protein